MKFLKIDSPLFIKILVGYTFSIVCKIEFWIFLLTPTSNASGLKKSQQHSFIKNMVGTDNYYILITARN